MLPLRRLRPHLISPYIDMVKILFNRISSFGKAKFFISESTFAFFSLAPARLVVVFCLFLVASPAVAVQGVLLPWQLLGWDGEFRVRHKATLASLEATLARSWLENPQSFDRWMAPQGRPQSLNQRQLSQSLKIGATRLTLAADTYLIPLLCPVGERLLFALQLVDTKTELLLAGTQFFSPRAPWETLAAAPEAALALQGAIPAMMQELEIQASRNEEATPRDGMKLSFRQLRGSDSSKRGAHLCLTALLAHSLLGEQRISAPLNPLEATHLRDQLKIPEAPARHSRFLAIDWGRFPKGPDSFPFTARWAESVLGGPIAGAIEDQLSIAPQLRAPPLVQKLFLTEKAQLKLADRPQVAKIRGAWVYLDRGRAWGLELDDRLYLQDGERRVKGHVVGFFGPQLGIVSPRGYPVHEGAIVFIRKGQRAVKIGDSLNFDPTRFPTPWPPVQQPSAAAQLNSPE